MSLHLRALSNEDACRMVLHIAPRRNQAVTREGIQRVALKYLATDKAIILIVGQKDEILLGHPDHPVKLQDLSTGGFKKLPLRDPLTMKPMAAP